MAQRLCVFLGSSSGRRPSYVRAAARVGTELARRGIDVVFGGGHVGLMGTLADAALAAGGEVIGVIPDSMVAREWAHHQLSELHVTSSMHERKALMSQLADAFLALPGGIGTLEELFEVYTWLQLGFHHKPVGLLDETGYYAPLLGMLDRMCDEGFLDRETRQRLLTDQTLERILPRLGLARGE